jgi:hypothetical protein
MLSTSESSSPVRKWSFTSCIGGLERHAFGFQEQDERSIRLADERAVSDLQPLRRHHGWRWQPVARFPFSVRF